jgi:hypothetical protein
VHHLDEDVRSAIWSTLWSAIDADGGPTVEQEALLRAVGAHVLGIDGLEPTSLGPERAAAAVSSPELRRLVGEGLVILELVRRPASAALADQVDRYLGAFGYEGPDQVLVRDAVAASRERVVADWSRTRTASVSAPPPDDDPDRLFAALEALGSCAPGTLGHSLHEFVQRNGFTYQLPHLSLVGHDFAHVIAGYEPTPEGELALQAFLVAAGGGGQHASGLLASLLLYEVGLLPFDGIEPKVAALERPGAAELFAEAVDRGLGVRVDIQALDHLAMVDRDLGELRAELAVPEPVAGPSTFVR